MPCIINGASQSILHVVSGFVFIKIVYFSVYAGNFYISTSSGVSSISKNIFAFCLKLSGFELA